MGDHPTINRPVYVVIGASGGIGQALVRSLVLGGARVAAVSRDPERVQPLVDEFDVLPIIVSSADLDALDTAVASVREQYGRLDGVVNLAGSVLLKPAHRTSADEWQQVLEANLTTAFSAVRAAVRHMSEAGGSIVLLSSAAARIGLPNHEAIAAAKAGVIGLTLAAAASYAGRNIRVNAVAPGLVQTPLTAAIHQRESARNASLALHPLGRLGEPDDVASAIAWLLDPAQRWVTGQVIGVDGGLADLKVR